MIRRAKARACAALPPIALTFGAWGVFAIGFWLTMLAIDRIAPAVLP